MENNMKEKLIQLIIYHNIWGKKKHQNKVN